MEYTCALDAPDDNLEGIGPNQLARLPGMAKQSADYLTHGARNAMREAGEVLGNACRRLAASACGVAKWVALVDVRGRRLNSSLSDQFINEALTLACKCLRSDTKLRDPVVNVALLLRAFFNTPARINGCYSKDCICTVEHNHIKIVMRLECAAHGRQ
jgi:hypothetical protein